jgi:integrase
LARKRNAGEGSIFQRAYGRWCAQLDLGWEGGKRRRKYVYGATAGEVQDALLKARTDRAAGLPVKVERQSVAEYLQRWLTECAKPSTRPRTSDRYEQLIRLHIAPEIGKIRLEKLAPSDVQRLLNRKLAGGLSPKSVRHLRAVLTVALNRALRWGLVGRNAAALTDAPKLERHEIHPLTLAQTQHFIEAVRSEQFGPFFLLAATTGARRGELLAAKWADVDLDTRVMRITGSLQRIDGSLQVCEPKTAKSRRPLPLLDFVAEALKAHRARQLRERLQAGSDWMERGFVFTGDHGQPLDPDGALRDAFKDMLEKAELPDIRLHDLRHSAASLLLALNIHPRVVMELLGHSQISLTMDTYSHTVPEILRDAIDKLGAALNG